MVNVFKNLSKFYKEFFFKGREFCIKIAGDYHKRRGTVFFDMVILWNCAGYIRLRGQHGALAQTGHYRKSDYVNV